MVDRSMGRADLYPLVRPHPALEKLRLVQRLVSTEGLWLRQASRTVENNDRRNSDEP